MKQPARRRIAIIGAGWAGLSAALALHRRGYAVHLYEASRTVGGRAKRVWSPALECDLDNGQHILLGAYTETLALMRALGLDPAVLFHRERLALRSADKRFRLCAGTLPAPLHLLTGVLGARGLSVPERVVLIQIMLRLRRKQWRVPSGLSVQQWLHEGKQSDHLTQLFWRPLCLAALNTPPEQACAQLFANVLKDSLGGGAQASDLLIPTTDLSRLWPEHAIALLQKQGSRSSLSLGHAVRTLGVQRDGVYVDGQHYDSVIVAANAPTAHRLLAQLPETSASQSYLACMAQLTFLPIATLTLRLEHPWHQPFAMQQLWDQPDTLQCGQWLFDRSALTGKARNPTSRRRGTPSQDARQNAKSLDDPRLIHIVISDARPILGKPANEVATAITAQLQAQAGQHLPMPRVTGHHLIIEKRATFEALPALLRPANQTPWLGVWVAGDWTDTGYPAVLEGAVRSGQQAAAQILD